MKTKSIILASIFSLIYIGGNAQSSWDNFDSTGKVTYPFFNGTVFNQSYTNPSTLGLNTSAKCAQYKRDGASQYDVILLEPTGLIKVADVSDFRTGVKKMTLKVYSPVAGKTIQITLEDKNLALPTNFPTGRHSEYTAVTSVSNTWEILTFNLVNRPDTTVSDTTINRMVLLFDPNSYNSETYLFDDVMGPDLIDPCAGTVTDSSIGDDYACQRNVTFDFANGTHNQTETNPVTTGINTSPTCGKFTKYLPPTNDGAFGGTLTNPFTTATYNMAHIELYSPAGAQDFKIVFQDASNTDLLDSAFVTTSSTGWTKFDMNISSIPTSTTISKFVFLFNSTTSTEDSIYLDNFTFSFDNSIGIKENKSLNTLKVFPNPFLNQLTIESETKIEEITVFDLTGKTLIQLTKINKDKVRIDLQSLLLGSYVIQIRDENGNLNTEQIIKTNK